MRVSVTASARFGLTADGQLWTPNESLRYSFWTRYLDAFAEVRLLVRAHPLVEPPPGWTMASGPGVVPFPLPNFEGVSGWLRSYRALHRRIGTALGEAEAIQLRLPCVVGTAVWRMLESDRPYGVEVVGDPYDSLGPGGIRHPLRPLFRLWLPRQLRRQCAAAAAAAYVTEFTLQRRYPARSGAYVTHFSSADLREDAFVAAARPARPKGLPIRLITVGSLAVLYKAPDVLLDAVGLCVRQGLDLRLVLVGDGVHRRELEGRAAGLGLNDRVRFTGELASGAAVRSQLDEADLFVLPSRQEGLPRAMLEAMARALPCIGSTIGGIPELLPAEDLVPPGDVAALARQIAQVAADPERMAHMSARNLEKSRQYAAAILRQRRVAFYRYLRESTDAWLQRRGTTVRR